MKRIISLIEEKSVALSGNPFCQWILSDQSQHLSHEETFSFTPSMLYFILGFKDILTHLEYINPQSELELMINQHCLEDKNHWRWYLHDLKTLGFDDSSWGQGWSEFVENLWRDENIPTRDLVYLCIHLIKKNNSPLASLVMIECLESTFGVFMTTLKKRFNSSAIYQRLHFFGQTHHQVETNHSMGHWIDEGEMKSSNHSNQNYLLSLPITSMQMIALTEMVDQVFNQFELVFKTWLKTKNFYSQKMLEQAELAKHSFLSN